MRAPIKYFEKGLSITANGAWMVFNTLNKINQRPAFTPKWSDKPLLKSYEKTKPPLGWPRATDSLCPTCTREARQEILDRKKDVSVLLNEKVGEIKANIVERDGQILMVKDCPTHGHFEDVMAIDTDFFKHLEEVFPGRDIAAHNDEKLHNHGTSTVKHGRGSVLTIDLTNRCNMMCDPCFMDANQVGFVHELTWDEIKTMLDNGINNEQVGKIIQFALDNPKIISFLSFQPVSFTGRDEEVTDERREAQRYTLSHLAHDVKNQVGLGEPVRDWFPISFMSTFSDWADLMHVNDVKNDWGQLSCGCHPNCGTGMAVMIDKETKEAVPVTAFLHGDQLAKDIAKVNDAARGKFLTIVGMALCLMKNYDPFQSPTHFKFMDLLKKFDKNFNATGKNYGKVGPDRTIDDVMKRRQDRWNFLFIAGMWFQDLFNYDFRRTEQCIIPYATQEGEISFCAYNTGVGWRNIIEKMHMTATLTKWYEEHGRHEIFAGGKNVKMESTEHSLLLRDGIVTKEEQHDLDKLGIAKNAREEKLRARDAKQKNDPAYNARMAAMYREVVLKENPVVAENGFIPLAT